jgi:hypothetical protein
LIVGILAFTLLNVRAKPHLASQILFGAPRSAGPPRERQKAITQSEIAPTAPSLCGKRFDATEDRDPKPVSVRCPV